MNFVHIYWISVEGELMCTRSSFFYAMPLEKRKLLGFHSGKGSQGNPIRLDCGFTAEEMGSFIDTMGKYSDNVPSRLLKRRAVFISGRIAQAFEMGRVLIWLRDGFFAHCEQAARDNGHFVAALGRANGITYPMNFWCAMQIIKGVLHPIKALIFAYKKYIPQIFAAAAYRILLDGGPDHSGLEPAVRMYIGSVFSKHIRSGYHSLQTTWRVLCRSPGVLMTVDADGEEHDHGTCIDFWEYGWEELESTCDLPEYAVLERYDAFEEKLGRSALVSSCRDGCWKRAVMGISIKRSSLIRALHHHFDF